MHLKLYISEGAWLAQSEVHATLDPGVMSGLTPHAGCRDYLNK